MGEQEKKETKEYPEALLHIADHVTGFLISKKISDQEAAKVGLECAESIRAAFKGEMIYIPKAISYECSIRDVEILDMFNGSNFREVCQKYQITRRRIYQILFGLRNSKQPLLNFGDDNG